MKARTKTGAERLVCCPQESPGELVVDHTQEQSARVARSMTSGDINALVIRRYLGNVKGESCSLATLVQRSAADAEAVGRGDLSTPERMLMGQAQALQSMFADLALKAAGQGTLEGRQVLTTLALKCAAQSRQALTALADLRNPGVATFVRQANFSRGPQQINNGAVTPPAGNPKNQHNELLVEVTDGGTHLDISPAAATGGADSQLAPMGAQHGAQDPRR